VTDDSAEVVGNALRALHALRAILVVWTLFAVLLGAIIFVISENPLSSFFLVAILLLPVFGDLVSRRVVRRRAIIRFGRPPLAFVYRLRPVRGATRTRMSVRTGPVGVVIGRDSMELIRQSDAHSSSVPFAEIDVIREVKSRRVDVVLVHTHDSGYEHDSNGRLIAFFGSARRLSPLLSEIRLMHPGLVVGP
jgi:hypothetical protein